ASIAILLPVAVWGWRMLTHRRLDRLRLRLALWIGGWVLAGGFLPWLPRPPPRPPPTRPGGGVRGRPLRVPAGGAGGAPCRYAAPRHRDHSRALGVPRHRHGLRLRFPCTG